MTTIQKIREKVIEANPEIVSVGSKRDGHRILATRVERPIRLADVLLAMEAAGHIRGLAGGKRASYETEWTPDITVSQPCASIILRWNLREDDLEKQSPETVEFIGKVLGV